MMVFFDGLKKLKRMREKKGNLIKSKGNEANAWYCNCKMCNVMF